VADGGELLRRADVAMYGAKRSRAAVGVYDCAADLLEQERMRLVEDLGRALAEPGVPQVAVYFQPQVDVATGRVTGAEALVRWHHAELGVLTPDRFVHLAEANGLVAGLTGVVLRSAAEQAARWRAAGHDLRVSVNLSARCLAEPALFELLDEVLAGGLDPRRLVLEVTETNLMTHPEPALDATRRIAARGVGISIDDYGTGYSSLSYLNDLPAVELKIDKSFVGRAVDDPRTAAIVAGTVELAHQLGLRLVAEGVADAESLALMAELGCDESQGYLHSRPLPAEAFLTWLGERSAFVEISPVP
jgi:EAL domain-containing protein (putative c-di-GMP-specific phosphodiesterase class I)